MSSRVVGEAVLQAALPTHFIFNANERLLQSEIAIRRRYPKAGSSVPQFSGALSTLI